MLPSTSATVTSRGGSPSQRLAVRECVDRELQTDQRRFGFTHVGGDRPFEDDLATDQEVGDVGLEVAGEAVPARQTRACIGHPMTSGDLGHMDHLIKVMEPTIASAWRTFGTAVARVNVPTTAARREGVGPCGRPLRLASLPPRV